MLEGNCFASNKAPNGQATNEACYGRRLIFDGNAAWHPNCKKCKHNFYRIFFTDLKGGCK
jgi:hypothetical protein